MTEASCRVNSLLLFYLLQDGNTPLHVTALHNECCHVGDLMAYGADMSIQNKVRYSVCGIVLLCKVQ